MALELERFIPAIERSLDEDINRTFSRPDIDITEIDIESHFEFVNFIEPGTRPGLNSSVTVPMMRLLYRTDLDHFTCSRITTDQEAARYLQRVCEGITRSITGSMEKGILDIRQRLSLTDEHVHLVFPKKKLTVGSFRDGSRLCEAIIIELVYGAYARIKGEDRARVFHPDQSLQGNEPELITDIPRLGVIVTPESEFETIFRKYLDETVKEFAELRLKRFIRY